MHDLDQALIDIKTLRGQAMRGVAFRGYGPATVALTALLATAAGLIQARYIVTPAQHVAAWLGLWVATASVSVAGIAVEVLLRARRVHGGLADDMLRGALLQLLPSAGAGVIITAVLWRYAPASLWLLPGLWQILLSLGVFASCRDLAPAMVLPAFWYLLSGTACLALAQGAAAFSPWAMAVPFTLGEGLAALVLLVSNRSAAHD
jgi:hypothetical protein